MRLTTKTDYCLRVLIFLQKKKAKVKIQEIAEAYDVSKNHLSVAVNKLSELGYIISTPGPRGGIEFNPDSAGRTIADLVMAIEDFNLVECFSAETNTCTLIPNCKLKSIFEKATTSFLEQLKEYQIKDLV